MSTQHLRNISKSKFESFLELCGCKFIKDHKGHLQYTRADLTRPITFQNHIDPVPIHIVQNNLRTIGYSKKDFFAILSGKMIVERVTQSRYKLVEAQK